MESEYPEAADKKAAQAPHYQWGGRPTSEVAGGTANGGGLVFGVEDRPSPAMAALAALQHLLAIIVPIVTPGLLICQAIGVSPRDTNLILSMSLVISGIATFLQCYRVGPLGAGLLIVQGTSFNVVGPMIAGGVMMVEAGTPAEAVMAAIFGVVIAGSFIEIAISRILPYVQRLIPPLVTGIVVLLIGLTLIKVGLISMGGGFGAMSNGTFGNATNLTLSGVVLLTIIVLNRLPNIWIRSAALVIALAVGCIVAAAMGVLDLSKASAGGEWIHVPTPLHFGLSFSWALFAPMIVIYLVTSLEAIGDITATSKISKQPVQGKVWLERIKGGVLVNGVNSTLAGVFNTFPSSVFAQNNGVIQLTGIASRYVGMYIAGFLVILGLFPRVSGILQSIPESVLGGAVIVMFGAVAAAGIQIIAESRLDRRALLILAISLGLGLGVSQVPEIVKFMPSAVADVLSSGVATGGICAIVLNLILADHTPAAETTGEETA